VKKLSGLGLFSVSLATFRKIEKTTITLDMSVRLSICLSVRLYVCMYVCMSIRPLTWNNSAPTGRIFIKFGI
jgi:hypothetical protein